MEMVEQVEALPEELAGVKVGLPGCAAPAPAAAAASWLLPAAPTESAPAAASAGTRSCREEDSRHILQFSQSSFILYGRGGCGWRGGGQGNRLVKM